MISFLTFRTLPILKCVLVNGVRPTLLFPEGYPVVPTVFSVQSIFFSWVQDATLPYLILMFESLSVPIACLFIHAPK